MTTPLDPWLDDLDVREREKSAENVPGDLRRDLLLSYLLILQQYRRGGDQGESAVEVKIEEPPKSAPTPMEGSRTFVSRTMRTSDS